ncbi:hypothetical protein COS16_05360, partial [Candidatus Desantisbacteria bacterium CG02_land_8_20_14_3_00_49_13]
RKWGTIGSDTIVYLTAGQGYFYYKDYKGGNPVISAENPDAGLLPAAQTETISAASLEFITLPFEMFNRESGVFSVTAADYWGETDVLFNDMVCLSTSSPVGRFSLSNTVWQDITIARFSSGLLSGYYLDHKGGNPVITVSQPDAGLFVSQTETVNMPVMFITAGQKNLKTGAAGDFVAVDSDETIEYTVMLSNLGMETMTNVILFDTQVFNTSTFSPTVFVSIEDTGVCDTWAWTADLVSWIAGSPAPETSIRGLRWQFSSLGINKTKAVRFRVRVK